MGYPTVTDDDGTGLTGTIFNAAFHALLKTHVQKIARSSISLDLSDSATTVVALHCERACTLIKATILYTEASSADAGVALKIGKETDDDYYYTGTSETDKAQWYSLDVTLLQTDLAAGDTILFYCAGSKVGTGEVMLILEYEFA